MNDIALSYMAETQIDKDVGVLREGLGGLPEPVIYPAFIVVSGLPGTGKSYFCRQLAERLNFPTLESDDMRRKLFPKPNHSQEESARLFRASHRLIEDLLRKGIPLIFDATNLIERHREHLYRIADRAGARIMMILVKAPPELVKQRLQDRLSGLDPQDKSEADWGVYRRMSETVQQIRHNHFSVDTSSDITPVIDRIEREVSRK